MLRKAKILLTVYIMYMRLYLIYDSIRQYICYIITVGCRVWVGGVWEDTGPVGNDGTGAYVDTQYQTTITQTINHLTDPNLTPARLQVWVEFFVAPSKLYLDIFGTAWDVFPDLLTAVLWIYDLDICPPNPTNHMSQSIQHFPSLQLCREVHLLICG